MAIDVRQHRLPATGAARALPRVCSKVTAERLQGARQAGVDVLRLLPFPDRALPSHVVEAVMRAMRENTSPPSRGGIGLREAATAKLYREYGFSIDPSANILVTNGAMHAINLVCRAVLDPDDEVLIPSPCYFFFGAVTLAGGRSIHVPADESTGYALDIEALQAAITPRTKLLILASPSNPTGRVATRHELEAISRMVARHDLLVLFDEAYNTLIYDDRAYSSLAQLPEIRERLILIQSMTKSYAMSPWRVGFLVGPAPIVQACTELLEWELLMNNHVAQAAAEAALTGPADWLTGIAAEFQANRDQLWKDVVAIPVLRCLKPQGGPFLSINVSALGLSGESFHQRLVSLGVPSEPGEFFQAAGHVRLSLGADQQTLAKAAARLRAAVASAQ